MDHRTLVPGEADEAHLAFVFGAVERLDRAALGVESCTLAEWDFGLPRSNALAS
jgi:hypothetical protein